jgi:translocation and assembly module TamB
MRTALRIILGVIAALLALILIAVVTLTNTDWGREQVRRVVVSTLGKSAHGVVRIGKIGGNLLKGVILTDLSITDSAGNPFFSVERARAQYDLPALFDKRIVLASLALERPVIVLDQPPGGEWNYERIFPSTGAKSTTPGFGSWITLNNVRITDGRLTVRTPWAPADSLAPAVRDSVIDATVHGETRAYVVPVSGGYQSVMDFRSIQAALPHIRLADPDSASRLIQVGALRMVALPFRPPAAEIRDLHGDFRLTSDSLWFRDVAAALPDTRLRADGRYLLESGDLDLTVRTDPLALADLRWIYPQLPSSGHGALQFTMAFRKVGESEYAVRNAHLELGDGASLSGQLALAMGTGTASLRVHDTDLRFSGIDTRLIEQMAPGVEIPRRGTLGGHAVLAGSMRDMQVNGTVAFDAQHGGTSRLTVAGGVGMVTEPAQTKGAPREIRLDHLRLRFDPLQLDLARAVSPKLPIDGTLTGTAMVDGSTTGRLVVQANAVHRGAGAASSTRARGVSRLAARGTFLKILSKNGRWVDADVRFTPLSLTTVGRFAPALGLHGAASGHVHVVGALSGLELVGDLRLPDGGRFTARGSADVASTEKQYDLTTQLDVFNLHAMTTRGPSTSVTAVAHARGRGTDPKTMEATLAADVSHSSVDSIPFDSLHLRVAVANGLATIDSLLLTAPIAHVAANGTFGLGTDRTGQLTYSVEIDSLAGLRRLLPRTDTGVVHPRPGRVAAAFARARADSARRAQRTEVERAVTGAPPPRLRVDTAHSIARDSIGGVLYTAGTVRGGLSGFDVRGRLAVRSLVAGGGAVRNGRVEYVWQRAQTPASTIIAGALLDSVQAAGFALDSIDLRATYRPAGGRVDLAIYQDTGTTYRAQADYTLRLDRNEVRITDLGLRFGPTQWAATHPSVIGWGKSGIDLDRIELRDRENGRIYLNGHLPATGPMDVELEVVGLQLANIVSLLQGDLTGRGTIAVAARMTGTREQPQIRAALGLANASFRGSPLPDLRTTIQYADTMLAAHAELVRGRVPPLAELDAHVPVNLALSGATGSRLLDRPMRVDFHAVNLPLDALPSFTDVVSNVRGQLYGAVAARGTPQHPSLAGKLALDFASFHIVPLGVTMANIGGALHMLGDSIVIDSLRGSSGDGTVSLAGGVGIKTATQPSFDLRITGRNALIMDNTQGRLNASANIAVRGPFTGVGITGRAQVLNGAIYLPEGGGRNVIAVDDSTVAHVVDTSIATYRKLIPAPSPLMQNLHVDMTLGVSRDTWVRSADANVEVYTPEPLRIHADPAHQAIVVDGPVSIQQGQYTYLGRQFILSHGTATFTGSPELNPLLQLNAVRQIQLAGRGALGIQIVIGGTLEKPTVTLQSDAQPPISQTDLLSYLAFGTSSSSLLQFGGSSALAGQSTGSGNLAGKAAGLATRQLAAVAVDVLAKQLQTDVARSVGADVLNITPADIPTDFTLSGIETLLAGTQIEAGKYVNRRTFVVFQARPTLVAPGLRVEHRMPKGYSITASLEPRFQIPEPTLSENTTPKLTSVFGAFLNREWRF